MSQFLNFESGGKPEDSPSILDGLDQASRELLRAMQGSPLTEDLSIDEARHQMLEGQRASINRPMLRKETFVCAGCEVTIIRSLRLTGFCAPVFFLHGGGWLMGDTQTHSHLVAELAERSDCAIIFIDYPRAPEVQFPRSLEVAFSAICEILAKSTKYQIDSTRFALAGDSAGGNLATSLAIRFQEEDHPKPQLQVLLYPALDARMNSTTYKLFGTGLNLTGRTMRWFWRQYGNEAGKAADPLFSPTAANDTMLRGMPDTLIITSEFDVLRKEGENYAVRLRRAGVDVCSVRFGGVLHGFMVTESLAKSSSGGLAIQLVADYLRSRLGQHLVTNAEDRVSD